MTSVVIRGADEAIKRLKDLDDRVRINGVRGALRVAARLVVKKAKANARRLDDPDTKRVIASNIGYATRSKFARQNGNTAQMVSVGVRTGKGRIPKGNPDTGERKGQGETKHWHLLELGTEKMAARPFIRPAAENSAQEITDAFANALDAEIDKAFAKVK